MTHRHVLLVEAIVAPEAVEAAREEVVLVAGAVHCAPGHGLAAAPAVAPRVSHLYAFQQLPQV